MVRFIYHFNSQWYTDFWLNLSFFLNWISCYNWWDTLVPVPSNTLQLPGDFILTVYPWRLYQRACFLLLSRGFALFMCCNLLLTAWDKWRWTGVCASFLPNLFRPTWFTSLSGTSHQQGKKGDWVRNSLTEWHWTLSATLTDTPRHF